MNLAIIPARAGSKRIKNKNIKLFAGKPMIYYAIRNLKKTNIKSEGLVKGTIQVPADGNPIILLSDHGTIGGYPKFGVVISADYDKLIQLPPGSKIKFKEILLKDAENLYKIYNMETNNILNKIKWTLKLKKFYQKKTNLK